MKFWPDPHMQMMNMKVTDHWQVNYIQKGGLNSYKSPALLADFSCAQSPTKEPIHRLSSSPNLHLKGIN